MYSDRQLRVLLGAAAVAVVSAALGGLAYLNKPLAPEGDPVFGSPQLVIFETESCGWCDTFRHNTARTYEKSEFAEKAPIKYLSIDDGPPPKRYRLDGGVRGPMVVMFDQYGRELGRMASPPTEDAIEALVRHGLKRVPAG